MLFRKKAKVSERVLANVGLFLEDALGQSKKREAPSVSMPAEPPMSFACMAAPKMSPPKAAAPMASASRASAPKFAAPKLGAFVHGSSVPQDLEDIFWNLDATFSQTLFAIIDRKGLRDSQVYKRANISRQHFAKIRKDDNYRPTKKTVLALALALELDLDDTCDLLERSGFALSHSSKADLIVEYCIDHGIYDVNEVNQILFHFDQPILGS